MRRLFKCKIITAILVSCFLTGCVYTNIQRPLGTEFNKTELGSKTGLSSNHSLLWLVAWGDAGTKAAAENGNIKVIQHADTKLFSVLFGLYTEVTTVVYGD
ncbi:MAG: TRL domain-containing protein [Desulfuromonadaceae bacterium]|nr:TRL domain-containing protein [Desulfuromonadaceae bacterium]MDD2855684.1 TRL domain-containing protein [Desulfuromonadaceae bacterium]